ncbi:MAG: hypothetical protein NT005_02040, partial [Spirochaetes bacterium]|nr:hypothetical protein [Spirochaetota bacterium]
MSERSRALLLSLLLAAVLPAGLGAQSLLSILAPADVSPYGEHVDVRGKVGYPVREIESVSWSLLGTKRAGRARVESDGTFSFGFSTEGLHLTQLLRITARTRLGSSVERTIMLLDPEAGPVLTVDEPSDRGYSSPRTTIAGRIVGARVGAISWGVAGTALRGRANVGSDGGFAVELPTAGLSGRITVLLRAVDENGHLALRSVALEEKAAEKVAEQEPAMASHEEVPVHAEPVLEAPAVEEQLIEVQEAVHEAPAEPQPDFALWISAPQDGSYYRSRILIEGLAGSSSMAATSVSYQVEGAAGLTG